MGRGYRYRDEPCSDVIDNLVQPCYKLATVSNTTLLNCYVVSTLLQPCTTRLQQACDKVVTSVWDKRLLAVRLQISLQSVCTCNSR